MKDTFNNKKENSKWNCTQIKLEHQHSFTGFIYPGAPISTSLEIAIRFNPETQKEEWIKTVSHTYISLENSDETTTDTHQEKLENPNDLIQKLETYDLPNLKSNYFIGEGKYRFSRWELTYNENFKIQPWAYTNKK